MAKRRISAKEKERIAEILHRLDEQYTTKYRCYLDHKTPWELLVATILSAQCTDARVNIVTKDLFVKYPDVHAFAAADLKELEQEGVIQISSQGLGERMCLTASQIRQDINCFGGFGRQGYGYSVPELRERIGQILGVDRYAPKVNGAALARDEFLVTGVLSMIVALCTEKISWEGIREALIPIL